MANPSTHVCMYVHCMIVYTQSSQANTYKEDFKQEREDRARAHSLLDDARTQIRNLEADLQERILQGEIHDRPPRNVVYSHEEMAAVQRERDEAVEQVELYRAHADGFYKEMEEERIKVSRLCN